MATALFASCEAAWDDELRHDKFVKYCSTSGLLATAARQYRRRLELNPEDLVATRMQQRIVTMASFLLTTHHPPPEPLTRSRWFLVLVGVAAIAGLLAALLYGR
jgi:predicted TPR repeat methyltransferase